MTKNNQGMLCKVFCIWSNGFAKLPLSPYRCQQKIGYYVTIYEKSSSIRVIVTFCPLRNRGISYIHVYNILLYCSILLPLGKTSEIWHESYYFRRLTTLYNQMWNKILYCKLHHLFQKADIALRERAINL